MRTGQVKVRALSITRCFSSHRSFPGLSQRIKEITPGSAQVCQRFAKLELRYLSFTQQAIGCCRRFGLRQLV